MNAPILTITLLTVLLGPGTSAQTASPTADPNPALEVIQKFGSQAPDKAAEPTPTPEPAVPNEAPDEATAPKPPADAPITDPVPAVVPDPRQSLAVRVENLQAGTSTVDPSQVKLLSPFPPKPLGQAPAGWRLKSSPDAPPITRKVELSAGNHLTLSIRPDLLVPDADGTQVFSVSEPGFDPTLGYHQPNTVGTILSHSINQLDTDSMAIGLAIDKLQQILLALPKPEPPPPAVEEPAMPPKPDPKAKPTRKR